MPKARREYDIEEVKEIVDLKLKELGGIKSKLTYNSVFVFNKKIAGNDKYRRSNGQLFKLYGYDFWYGEYNGEYYYGRTRIDEVKNSSNVQVVGEEYTPDMQDIITLVNDFYKKPDVLVKRLIKVFNRDKSKIKILEQENAKLKKKNELLNKRIDTFENGLITLFYNSAIPHNSLENVMNLTNSKDSIVYEELLNMFDKKKSRLNKVLNINDFASKSSEEASNNIISINNTEEVKKKRRSRLKNDL
ncbi:hypothetical protein [Clostridium ljungdahlii]|uniref:Uncharacterized protein n=1 Tax=Clostridium ljungdahlii TaxID=1538 RepID=A0A162L9C6_9CLOT|nr:hypothetical protein [Clostridium ljungdahlii]OAA90486.1 hypothetical protein WY13_01390 [Clostridium ljungdahlii]